MYSAEPGDILLYRTLHTLGVGAIDIVEELKDGRQPRLYYHCAIAVDAQSIIESNGRTVLIKQIPPAGFDVFRPPLAVGAREEGLSCIRALAGQKYDCIVVIDDVLRALTRNLLHLPASVVESQERHRKICSSLVVCYLEASAWHHGLNQNALPEDIYLLLCPYQIHTD